MRNLLNFLLKYNYWFLFILLEVASFVLLFRFNRYQQSAFFTSANTVVGAVYEVSGGISSYFHLKSVNEDLLDRNMVLEQQITNLEKALREQQLDSMAINSIRQVPQADYQLFKAHVIKNSLNLVDNYITLDKGSSSGIRSEMGVVDGNGIVGIVYETSPSYSVVISVLNSKSNISCKIIGSDYFGYLKWEHGDSRYAYLKDLPRHAEFNLGDTVVTSGFSTVFPEGIMVGTVDDMSDSNDGLSYLLKIKLATDFGKLSDVRVVARTGQEEQKQDTDEQSMVDVGTSQVESENHPLSGDEENLDNTESTSANGTTDGETYGNTVDNNDVDGTAYVDNENSVVGENDSNAQQGEGISSMNTGDGASIASDSETTDVSASAINLPEINFSEDTLMEWPVNGNILLDYSMDQTTYFPTLDQYKLSPAIAVGAVEGAPVVAAVNGTVYSVEQDAQTGTTLTMEIGNGYQAIYGQLTDLTVSEGDTVKKGTTIGYIAQPTKYYSTEGTNLYFEMKKDGEPIDPIAYLP